MIRRRGQQAEDEESSSDEEDAFAVLSRKTKRSKFEGPPGTPVTYPSEKGIQEESEPKMALPKPITSSMKRHHKPNDDRKAKMDALLQELEAEKQKVSIEPSRFIPEKKGSFVDPAEEHLTTNIFVGNLAPSITEEDLTELFLQFGELYSIKIMWPRTPAERTRNRNTGFVCFMNREDADEAMEACNETDPFNVGRPLMMRWGKNVKNSGRHGARGDADQSTSEVPVYATQPGQNVTHGSDEISIHIDSSPAVIEFQRPQRIGNVSKAAKFDSVLYSKDAVPRSADQHSTGRLWAPPPLDQELSSMERERCQDKGTDYRRQQGQAAESSDYTMEPMTGRQIELARRNRRKGKNTRWEAGTKLSLVDRDRFNWLVRKNLTISRDSICSAMAFCFEKSGAAHEISALLRDTLMEDSPHVTIDMRIARLYLLSDILFNSQQPGVRNAFFYRDALEKMAPDIFTSLGRHGAGQIGRMTMNKLRTAVSAVLGAWTEWSVYNPAFLDELEARFSGKSPQATADGDCKKKVVPPPEVASTEKESSIKSKAEAVILEARGTWTAVGERDGDTGMNSEEMEDDHIHDPQDPCDEDLDGSPLDDFVTPGHG